MAYSVTAKPFNQFERSLAWRYLRARRAHGGVALISIISFVGIMLAVATLIIVMSVMNGFRSELLARILGVDGHVFVQTEQTQTIAADQMAKQIRLIPGVTHAFPVVEGQVMASATAGVTGALVLSVVSVALAVNARRASNRTLRSGLPGLAASRLAPTARMPAPPIAGAS